MFKRLCAVLAALFLCASPVKAQTANIPAVYELNALGKIQGTWNGAQWWDPSPYTSHTFTLDASYPTANAVKVLWRVCWTATAPAPGRETAIIRLYTRTPDSTAPKIGAAIIRSSTMRNSGQANVSNDAIDITTQFNAFIAAGAAGHFGFDWAGDNTNPITIYTSRLEVIWED
jgi:hypothetical protein